MKKLIIGSVIALSLGSFINFATIHAHAQTADTTPPTAPASISASLTQSYQVYVSWTPSTDNVRVNGYYLYRNGGFIATVPGQTTYLDSLPGGSYEYSVSAYDAAGNVSAQSNTSSYITVPPDYAPPSMPTNLQATMSSSSVTLSWSPSTDDRAVAGYYIYRNGVRIFTPSAITGTSFTDTGLTAGNTYSYAVAAYDAAGNISDRATSEVTTIFDITPPSTPGSPTVIATSSNEIDLAWSASTDNIGVGGYYIYRNGVLSLTVSSNTLSFADRGLSAQTQYSYAVAAFDTVGNVSGKSNAIAATTFPADLTAPTPPNTISAMVISGSQINLSWSASRDNVGVTGYSVYRNAALIGQTTSTSYTDIGLATSTSYNYAVRAYDAAGNTSPQATVTATTLASNPATTAITQPAGIPTAPPTPIPPPPISQPTPTIVPPTPITPTQPTIILTQTLYYGLQNSQVTTLQQILIQKGYAISSATGFFGLQTQKAVEKFQCNQAIICSGTAASTGWGRVGPRTRNALIQN